MPGLPDLTDQLTDLATLVDQLTHRVDVLEQGLADHQAGAVRRQTELDQVRATNERLRWAISTGRRP